MSIVRSNRRVERESDDRQASDDGSKTLPMSKVVFTDKPVFLTGNVYKADGDFVKSVVENADIVEVAIGETRSSVAVMETLARNGVSFVHTPTTKEEPINTKDVDVFIMPVVNYNGVTWIIAQPTKDTSRDPSRQIQILLNSQENWSADTLDAIADILRHSGYPIDATIGIHSRSDHSSRGSY